MHKVLSSILISENAIECLVVWKKVTTVSTDIVFVYVEMDWLESAIGISKSIKSLEKTVDSLISKRKALVDKLRTHGYHHTIQNKVTASEPPQLTERPKLNICLLQSRHEELSNTVLQLSQEVDVLSLRVHKASCMLASAYVGGALGSRLDKK